MRDVDAGAEPFVPDDADLEALGEAARSCRGCDLYADATQTVFGEGDPAARVVLLGEQPGDQEDKQGRPFVGPAGRLLSRALEDAGIDRDTTYVTNAVKHFRFSRQERGKRRIHRPPTRAQIVACRPWLNAELRIVDPDVLVCLGATAAKAIFGPSFRLTRERGTRLDLPALTEPSGDAPHPAPAVVATVHPSAILRADDSDRDEAYAGLVADLRDARDTLAHSR